MHQEPKSEYVMLLGLYVKDLAATYLREILNPNPVLDFNTVKQNLKQKFGLGKVLSTPPCQSQL